MLGELGILQQDQIVGYFFFGESPQGFFMDAEGPPPKDPEARKEWFSERMESADKKFYILDEQLPSWKELDTCTRSLLKILTGFINEPDQIRFSKFMEPWLR